MSIVLRARKKVSTPLPATGLWLIVGLVIVFFLVRYGTELLREQELRTKAAQQSAVNRDLRDDNARLRASLLYFQSDRYIEQRAREDLNLRRQDEAVLIPVMSPDAASIDEATSVEPEEGDKILSITPAATQSEGRPNWEQWMGLFAPSR